MTHVPSARIIAFIKGFETCAKQVGAMYHAYLPTPHDRVTIGWGSTGPGIDMGTRWTKAECDERFDRDMTRFANNVGAQLGNTPTTQAQFDALVSLAYNIGMANFASSSVLREHKAGNHKAAASHFLDWNKQRQNGELVVLNGLTTRRKGEAAIYSGILT